MNGGQWLLDRLRAQPDLVTLVEADVDQTRETLGTSIEVWKARLQQLRCGPGSVVAVQGDYSCASIALLLACVDLSSIVVPLAPGLQKELPEYLRISEAQVLIRVRSNDDWHAEQFGGTASNSVTRSLIESEDPGIIIFSSGSTGAPKATLHNLAKFLAKYERERQALRTVAVPPMDHVAGLDTLFYCLSSGGTLVIPEARTPEAVCRAIARHRVELLPASAAFLNLLLGSQAYERYDLSSLRFIAYGSDVMPEATLARLRHLLPDAALLQKYGTTEFGSPSTKSKGEGSLWLKIEDKGCVTKIVDGVLWVKPQSAMVGYLNAPSPFDQDGWLNTGDVVEEAEGGYIRILGRKSDIINVGGHKVFPIEVETALLEMSNVLDVVVYGMSNTFMGNVVAARFRLKEAEDVPSLKRRVREFCRERLASYKIPVMIETTETDLVTARQKKVRRETAHADHG